MSQSHGAPIIAGNLPFRVHVIDQLRLALPFAAAHQIFCPGLSLENLPESPELLFRGLAAFVSRSHEATRLRRQGLRSEEHTSELQSQSNLVCRLLLEKKKK